MYRTATEKTPQLQCRNCKELLDDIGVEAFDGSRCCDDYCGECWKIWKTESEPFFAKMTEFYKLLK